MLLLELMLADARAHRRFAKGELSVLWNLAFAELGRSFARLEQAANGLNGSIEAHGDSESDEEYIEGFLRTCLGTCSEMEQCFRVPGRTPAMPALASEP